MNRLLLLFGFVVCLGGEALGQAILNQRRYSWEGRDDLTDVVALGDGTFLAVGEAKFTQGTALAKLNDQGDTLWTTSIPIWRYYIQKYSICRLSTGQIYVAAVSKLTGHADKSRLARIGKDGSLYWFHDLPGLGPNNIAFNINHLAEGPKHTLLIAGDADDPLGNATEIGYLACYDTNGVVIWDKQIREHPTFTLCNRVERTRQGTVLVSGTAGSRIWAAELSADTGGEIRRTTFYQSRGLIFLDYTNAWVYQAPNDRYLVSGYTQTSQGYIGLHQGWSGAKIWGGESTRFIQPSQVNEDGSIVFFQANAPIFNFHRIASDSTTIWNLNLPLTANQNNIIPSSYSSISDSSAIIVGSSFYQDSTDHDWSIVRISNFGIPYDPTLITKIGKPRELVLYPYPNPCRKSLGFAGLQGRAGLRLYDAQGRLCLEGELAGMVDVSALAPGLYHYQIQVAGKRFEGRIVKE